MPLMRRRRPLMRAAMVGGGAYVAGKHAQRGAQQESRPGRADQRAAAAAVRRAAAPYAPPPPAAPAAPAPAAPAMDPITALTQLKGLLDAGVLTQAEFEAQKQRILAGG